MRRLLAAGLVAVIVGGCQQAPAKRMATQTVVVGSRTTQLMTEGDALAGQKDWAGAALKYQAASTTSRARSRSDSRSPLL